MNSIKNWLASYNITTHSVTVVVVFLITGFYEVQPFHDLVMQIYNALPGWVESALLAAFGLYAWYRKGEPTTATTVDGTNSLNLNK